MFGCIYLEGYWFIAKLCTLDYTYLPMLHVVGAQGSIYFNYVCVFIYIYMYLYLGIHLSEEPHKATGHPSGAAAASVAQRSTE